MAGLNDKYFLADDSMETPVNPIVTIKAFKDGEEGEEAPELRDDIDLIAAATEELSIQLRGLELFKDSITNAGGMSQSIALEHLELLPNLINDEQPVGCFTKYPSKTLYAVALEEADTKEKNLFEKFKEFLISMFKRLTEWLKSFIHKDEVKLLSTKENVALLTNAKQTLDKVKEIAQETETASEELLKATATKITEVHQKDIAEGKAEQQKEQEQEQAKLEKLVQYVQTFKANSFGPAAVVAEINSMLGKLPTIRKILANTDDINPLLFNHTNTTQEVNALIHDVKQCIDKADYKGLKQIMDDGRFAKVKEAAHNHALAIIEFKALPVEYTAVSFNKFYDDAHKTTFLQTMSYGTAITSTGLTECEATSKAMDDIQNSIEQMASYKWSDSEGNAQAFFEELKDFNKSVIIPVVQRISFSFSVVSQLVNFLNSLIDLGDNIRASLKNKLKQLILAKAKELGISEQDANRYI